MISMLVSVDLTPDEAAWTADETMKRDACERTRKLLDAMSLTELAQEYAKQFGLPADSSIGATNLKELILTDRRLNVA
jgi:hypothetical protein